ncbi:MAG: FAD binding domain-containing protein [Flavobacteriales bacterium]
MHIQDFNYHRPNTLEDAMNILASSADAIPLAGGTDIMVEINMGQRHHRDIVSLAGIAELKAIREDNGNLSIGAGATHSMLIESLLVQERYTVIAEASRSIGTEQIRNIGTIGGNLCTGASCCDTGPALIALGATAELTSPEGMRNIAMKDFFINHKETALQKGEIMTRILVPAPLQGTGAGFVKFGYREAAAISVASVAVMLRTAGGICSDACVATGAVAPTPMISPGATAEIKGRAVADFKVDSVALRRVGEAAAEDALPIDDIRGTVEYRRNLISTLTQRAVMKALQRIEK